MRRALTLIAAVAAAIIASRLVIENVIGISLEALASAWLAHAGAGTAATVIALLGADLFLPIPSSLIMVLSGAAFGVVWGSVVSLVGSVGGEWLGSSWCAATADRRRRAWSATTSSRGCRGCSTATAPPPS